MMAVICGPEIGRVSPAAAFEVRVRGHASLELEATGAGTTLGVRGRLVDDVGAGLVQRRVDLVVRDERLIEVERARVYTDFNGGFSWSTERAPGVYSVEAGHAGSEHLSVASARASARLVPEEVELRVQAPAFVLGGAPAPVELQASSGGIGVATYVSVYRAREAVAAVELDAYGRGTIELAPFLKQGDNRFDFVVEPSPYRDEVHQSRSVRRGDSVAVTGQVEQVFLRLQRGVEIGIEVSDERGGVPDLRVVWEVRHDGEVVRELEGMTDAAGRARGFVEVAGADEGRWEVSAEVFPDAGAPLSWPGERWDVKPAPWERPVRGLAVLAAVLALLWFGRGALLSFVRRARQIITGFRAREASRGGEEGFRAELDRGHEQVCLDRLPEVSDALASEERRVVVELWDRWRERPVAEGVVRVEGPEGVEESVRGGPQGRCSVSRPSVGQVTLMAQAPGFVLASARLDASSPARVRLSMTPVPLKIRELYRWLIQRAHGDDLWGTLTPAQIAGALSRHMGPQHAAGQGWQQELERWRELAPQERPNALLRVLTAAVEETNFSGHHYDVEVWHRVREVVLELDRLGVEPVAGAVGQAE
ncbi:hypothetical protein DL240_06225 [Lujinxingia litoralis]|uniref:Uncharacterized protein n=2 Tax=Lujinxingia litoralis TaxID=2211119 RepID=A0A328CB89_9DELT|nr:hypothetical protein DL240_06225 [Lujinxingia litoralis]